MEISVHEFRTVLATKAQNSDVDFIDVRSPEEYAEHHIAGVRNIPLEEVINRRQELNNKKEIYIHCLSGGRSQLAVDLLSAQGIKGSLINVTGGLLAWHNAGFPIISQ